MRVRLSLVLVLLFCFAAAAPLYAQNAAGTLSALQAKETLSDEDQNQLRTWINQQIAAIVGGSASESQAAFERLRDGAKGTPGFRDAYVSNCLTAFGSAYQKAADIPAARLITLLNLFKDVRALDTLLQALRSEHAAIRAAAAIGLQKLNTQIAADNDRYTRVLNALTDAGKKESSTQTLQEIYQSLDFTKVEPAPNASAAVGALLNLLTDRANKLNSENVPAEGADLTGLRLGGKLIKSMNDDQKRSYLTLLARFMHYSVRRYATGERPLCKIREKASQDAVALRNTTELIIKDTEDQLAAELKPENRPNVTEAMTKADNTQMVIAMNNWMPILKQKLNIDLSALSEPAPAEETGDDEP